MATASEPLVVCESLVRIHRTGALVVGEARSRRRVPLAQVLREG